MKRMEEQFLEYVKKMMGYHEAIGLMYWDLRTGAPKKGVGQRSEVIGMLSAEAFQMSISEEMAAFIAKLSAKGVYEQLGEVTQRTLDECKKEYERNKKIPVAEYKEYVVLRSKAESVWEEAKATADFSRFRRTWSESSSFSAVLSSTGDMKGIRTTRCLINMSRA